MEHLCPEIDRLVSCYTCGAQSLPPFRLCLDAHIGCTPCAKYLPHCICGHQFEEGSHITFDWLVSAMKLQCKYRTATVAKRSFSEHTSCDNDDDDTKDAGCANSWYTVQELREHYLKNCTNNLFTCPLNDCNHTARIDTIVDHYETVHGPFDTLTPADNDHPYEVTFKIPSSTLTEVVHKIFNGYFLFVVKPKKRRKSRDPNPHLSMQNINPADPLRYSYDALIQSTQKEITVTVSILKALYDI